MNLSKQYAERILKSMFSNYDFDFTISAPDNDIILFDINTTKLNLDNNQIQLRLSKIVERSNQIKVEIYKRSESYETIGIYYINESEFVKSSIFWETMFIEHLLF